MTAPVVILGAGPAGIGAALALGVDATVLERSGEVAGLSRTIVLDGAVFDLGGHSFHTPHGPIRDLVFNALEMEEQRREAWCWTRDEWIAYPFQKHVSDLADPVQRAACLAGMAAAGDGLDAPHFDAFIDQRFGRAVADAFMRPYNQKLWGRELCRLALDWTGERVASPLGQSEEFLEHGGSRTPLQAETKVAYPARGGFGGIFQALAQGVHDLQFGTEVVRIDIRQRTLTTRSGRIVGWRSIVSTLSLPALLGTIPDVPLEIAENVALLETVPVNLVMVVLEGRGSTDRQRVYCPDRDMPGHKIVLNHTSSDWLRNQPRHGIEVEVSGHAANASANLVPTVIENLLRIGLIGAPSDVRRTELVHLPNGYPAPTHSRGRIIGEARSWLAEQDIHICGRFAEWAYINADEALARGLTIGRALASDQPQG